MRSCDGLNQAWKEGGMKPESPLREARKKRGWTATQLAVAAETWPSVISTVERGVRPGEGLRRRIALALGVSARSLWPEHGGNVRRRSRP